MQVGHGSLSGSPRLECTARRHTAIAMVAGGASIAVCLLSVF